MHQILSLRPQFSEKKGIWDKTDNLHFGKKWRFKSLHELFENLGTHLSKIPADERWNLYYTVAFCAEGKRQFREQNVIIFDIDGLGEEVARRPPKEIGALYAPVVCAALNIKPEETALVFSGNGLHFIIGLSAPIADPNFFSNNKRHYDALCDIIGAALSRAKLPGKPDKAVFDARRIMRLPGTINKKEGKPERRAELLQAHYTDIAFDITTLSKLPKVEAKDQINAKVLKKFTSADTQAVLDGCSFLKTCKEKPNEVSEAQWYAMLSILPRLSADGRELAHEYSAGHHSYSHAETEGKIDQALDASGPRTCDNIQNLWGKCATCPNFGKVNSPIMIQGPDYIKTQDSGFHNTFVDDKGNVKTGKPNYQDLCRYFYKLHPYITVKESRSCFTWKETHWIECDPVTLESFAQEHFKPDADTKMTSEFKNRILRTHTRSLDWLSSSIGAQINLRNGVLDLNTLQLSPHSVDQGFRYVVDYNYDPTAEAPTFKKFLYDIMDNREELVEILLEYVGYSFCSNTCWAQKALILTGDGSNGKSTFMKVIKALAGKDNFSALTLSDLRNEAARRSLEGKLFNMAEETPPTVESNILKNVIDGGDILVKKLYSQPYFIANTAKFIFACNELPHTKDTTHGYLRKLLIVPFDKKYEGALKDPFIKEKLLRELPGILNMVVAAYRRLCERQEFPASTAMNEEIEAYRETLDSVRAWYEDCVVNFLLPHTSDIMTPLPDLYKSYRLYTETNGDKPVTLPLMSRKLKHMLPNYKARYFRPRTAGRRVVHFRGVKFDDGSQF